MKFIALKSVCESRTVIVLLTNGLTAKYGFQNDDVSTKNECRGKQE